MKKLMFSKVSMSVTALALLAVFSWAGCGGGGGSSSTSGSGAVQITALDKTTADPLSGLTITGSGFDPSNAAISVVLIPESGGPRMVIPAISATATSIQILVPPIFDASTVAFVAGTVDVQVIQFDGSKLSTSSVLKNLNINAPPAAPSGMSVGTVTGAFIAAGQELVSFAQSNATTDSNQQKLASDLTTYNQDLGTLLTSINTVTNNPSQSITLVTTNSNTATLNSTVLALTDQLIVAYLNQQQQVFNGAPSSSSVAALISTKASSSATCVYDGYGFGPGILEQMCYGPAYEKTIAQTGGQLVAAGAQLEYGAYYSVLTGGIGTLAVEAGVVGADLALTMQIAVNAFGAWSAPFATGSKPAITTGVTSSILADIIDNALKLFGGPIKNTVDFLNMYTDFSGIMPPPGVTSGGVLVSGSQQAPTGTTAIVIYPSGIQLNAPNTQQVTPVFTLTIATTGTGSGTVTSSPAGIDCGGTCSAIFASGTSVTLTAMPSSGSTFTGWSGACSGTGSCVVTMNTNQTVTAMFDSTLLTGTYNGTLSGSYSGSGSGITASGSFNITITDGSITGSYSGTVTTTQGTSSLSGSIAGQMDATGNFSATSGSGSGGITWSGTITKSGTTLSGNGAWTGTSSSGSWTGSGTSQ